MQLELRARAVEDLGRAIALRALLPLVSDDSARAWIHLALEGAWEGHPAGEFAFDREVFKKICANFESQANPIPITYEHPKRDHGQPVPASGWIHKLEIRKDGLWAYAEFTPRAAQMIRDGEYRYCSVVVVFDSIDRRSGEEVGPELYEVGLTNTPFLDGQHPIKFSARERVSPKQWSLSMDVEKILAQVAKALGLEEDATREQMIKALDAMADLQEAVSGEPEKEPEPATEPEPMPEDVGMSAQPAEKVEAAAPAPEVVAAEPGAPEQTDAALGAEALSALVLVAEAAGVDAATLIAYVRDNVDQLAGLVKGAPASGTASSDAAAQGAMSREAESVALSAAEARFSASEALLRERESQIAELQARLDSLDTESVERQITDAVSCGKVLEADREKFTRLARADRALFAEWIKTEKPAVPMGTIAAGRGSRTEHVAASVTDKDPSSDALARVLKSAGFDQKKINKILSDKATRSTSDL